MSSKNFNDMFTELEYGDAICSLFELLFEPWMDDDDKIEFVEYALQSLGESAEEINGRISTGVANGYSVNQQLEICKQVLSNIR